MKHTDYQTKINEIKALECEELKLAIEAHGGCYEWGGENIGNAPIIAINSNKSEPEPQDIEVTKVAILDGQLKISGVDNKYREPVKFDVDDIFAGHLSFIIDYIPATDEISDVSIPLPPKTYKLQVGDKVWLFNTDRRDKASDRYGEVTKIARKYFYVKSGIHSEERFIWTLSSMTMENAVHVTNCLFQRKLASSAKKQKKTGGLSETVCPIPDR